MTVTPTHDLLLALAGRIDDDLLAWARELLVVGEEARATELVTAALIADRTALPPPVRSALVDAGLAMRSILDVHAALPTATAETAMPHAFDPSPPTATTETVTNRIAATQRELFARHTVACRSWLTWRLTPAGSATGPLPHPVVLVELADETGTGADVLSYQLATALERNGVTASVEVFTQGTTLPDYHRAARRAGRLLDEDVAGAHRSESAFAPQRGLGPIPAPGPAHAAGPAHAEPEHAGEPAEPENPPMSATASAWWTAVSSLPSAPQAPAPTSDPRPAAAEPPPVAAPLSPPVPLVRRPEPVRHTAVASAVESSSEFEARPRPRPRAVVFETVDEPTRAAAVADVDDPLNGPLREPLMAPLLDPTVGDDTFNGHDLFSSRTAGAGGFDPLPRHLAPAPAPATQPATQPEPSRSPEPLFAPRRERSWSEQGEYFASHRAPVPVRERRRAPRGPESTSSHEQHSPSEQLGSEPVADAPEAAHERPAVQNPDHPPTGHTSAHRCDARERSGSFPARPRPSPAPSEPEPLGEPRTTNGSSPAPEPEPAQNGVGIDPGQLGLRPDSVKRLSPTDRALLARLQSELGHWRPRQNAARPAQWRPPSPAGASESPPRPRPVRADPPDIAG